MQSKALSQEQDVHGTQNCFAFRNLLFKDTILTPKCAGGSIRVSHSGAGASPRWRQVFAYRWSQVLFCGKGSEYKYSRVLS